ncbi:MULTISPECIES: hypothetical protein [unclassified Burkholderia]|uniref:hypothetical protein n=1 Tax=unclassified Burkholderia TaxID=2613784 RepID=UPI00211D24E2|nr:MULTISPECIES: hypothetical protein [unclassified Burkholderia]
MDADLAFVEPFVSPRQRREGARVGTERDATNRQRDALPTFRVHVEHAFDATRERVAERVEPVRGTPEHARIKGSVRAELGRRSIRTMCHRFSIGFKSFSDCLVFA